jgi:dolichyl-phosphate-mannose--protein O-mannosyl transferase
MVDLFRHHLELGHHQNAAASPWYTWPVMGHPIVVKLSQHGTTQRYASSVGNPLLFLAASLTVVLAFLELPFRFFHARRRPSRAILAKPIAPIAPVVAPNAPLVAPSPSLVAPNAPLVAPNAPLVAPSPPLALWRPAIVLQVGWLALLSPWMVARGSYTFMYHYLPSYGFALVLLAGCVARFERKHVRQVLGFTVTALILTVYFAPVWGELPIGESAANQRLLFRGWRP